MDPLPHNGLLSLNLKRDKTCSTFYTLLPISANYCNYFYLVCITLLLTKLGYPLNLSRSSLPSKTEHVSRTAPFFTPYLNRFQPLSDGNALFTHISTVAIKHHISLDVQILYNGPVASHHQEVR